MIDFVLWNLLGDLGFVENVLGFLLHFNDEFSNFLCLFYMNFFTVAKTKDVGKVPLQQISNIISGSNGADLTGTPSLHAISGSSVAWCSVDYLVLL